MPLRDHFHPPLANKRSWDEVHGGWPMMIVQSLNRKLPRRYAAGPLVHLGAFAEIDVTAFEEEDDEHGAFATGNGNGGVATAIWAPSRPTLAVQVDVPAQDEYEVRVYDEKHGRRLVAAIELVSPANKDRPESRRLFVAKCLALLQKQVSVTIVDIVTDRGFSLYGELLQQVGQSDPAVGEETSTIYAVACRTAKSGLTQRHPWRLETWLQPLQVGQPLPTLPLWLADNLAIPLDLDESYEETCKSLRIP